MKRAEQLAWAALVGLLTAAVILLIGGIMYQLTGFWAGTMLLTGQSLVVGIAAWGLMLARQAAELNELPSATQVSKESETSTFRMSLGDDTSAPASALAGPSESKTLDTSFQRLVAFLSGFIVIVLATVTAYMVYHAYQWAQANPDLPLPIAGSFKEPRWLDELGLVMGLAVAGIYGVLYWITRAKRDTEAYGDAVSSNFTLGLTAMAALAVAAILAYLRVSYASELAAGVIAFFMLLQGLELIVNSIRSYAGVEELDQEAVDLQATPLVPMLGSVWLSALRMLFAQSVGLSGQARRERGVIARMMPRAILAIIVIAIGVSCVRVVQPGEVAVLERLGYAPTDKDGKLLPAAVLHAGPHLTFPWPIDQLVIIPTEQLQLTDVGTELHAPKEWKNVDFQFWTVRGGMNEDESDDIFITGDPTAQLLETYIQVRWRVADPAAFYTSLSHSDFFEKSTGETRALPIYEAIVQQCTSFAVTRTFAIHSLNQIMLGDRQEVEQHCQQILQDKLNSLGSGVEIVFLTIKDLHPPFWRPNRENAAADMIGGQRVERGPASAFEFVVSMREYKEQLINLARAESGVVKINQAKGEAASAVAKAQAYQLDKVARANGEAGRLINMLEKIDPSRKQFQMTLLEQQLMYATLTKDLVDPISKIIVDPSVDLQVFQTTDKGLVPMRPPG